MVKIKYKILKTYPEVRGVDVLFYTDDVPEGRTLHVQFMTEKMPTTPEEVDDYILGFAPRDDLEHKARCKKEKVDMQALFKLVGQERVEKEKTNTDTVEDSEFVPGEFLAGRMII